MTGAAAAAGLAVCVLLLSQSAQAPESAEAAGPFFLQQSAESAFFLPLSDPIGDRHSICRSRIEAPAPGPATMRNICYNVTKTGVGTPAPPPPPPPPYSSLGVAGILTVFAGTLDTSGNVSLTVGCLPSDLDDNPDGPMGSETVDDALSISLTGTATKAGTLTSTSVQIDYDFGESGTRQFPATPPCQGGVIAETEDTTSDPFTLTNVGLSANPDGDGCTSWEELGTNASLGGLRDPYNPHDHYDVNGDKTITVGGDILVVAGAFGPIVPTDPRDRGPTLTPILYNWSRSGGDGNINVANDILGVAAQFGHNCSGAPN
jgi:hypothetical protein